MAMTRRKPRITAAGRRFIALDARPTLPAIRPSAALRDAYQKKLDRLIAEMNKSIVYWVKAAWRKDEPATIAQDASAASALRAEMRKLARRWLKRFDEAAPEIAAYFAKASSQRVDKELQDALRKAGFTVKFKMSAAQSDALQATIGENVSLIRSIAEQHLTAVEGDVMRSVTTGRDLQYLTERLRKGYGVTRRRAEFIARDQNNKATATITRVRFQELGVKKARWLHSAGGKTPRPSHVAYSGKLYDVTKGAYIDGEWIFPGELPNCRCVSEAIIPGFDDED